MDFLLSTATKKLLDYSKSILTSDACCIINSIVELASLLREGLLAIIYITIKVYYIYY